MMRTPRQSVRRFLLLVALVVLASVSTASFASASPAAEKTVRRGPNVAYIECSSKYLATVKTTGWQYSEYATYVKSQIQTYLDSHDNAHCGPERSVAYMQLDFANTTCKTLIAFWFGNNTNNNQQYCGSGGQVATLYGSFTYVGTNPLSAGAETTTGCCYANAQWSY